MLQVHSSAARANCTTAHLSHVTLPHTEPIAVASRFSNGAPPLTPGPGHSPSFQEAAPVRRRVQSDTAALDGPHVFSSDHLAAIHEDGPDRSRRLVSADWSTQSNGASTLRPSSSLGHGSVS